MKRARGIPYYSSLPSQHTLLHNYEQPANAHSVSMHSGPNWDACGRLVGCVWPALDYSLLPRAECLRVARYGGFWWRFIDGNVWLSTANLIPPIGLTPSTLSNLLTIHLSTLSVRPSGYTFQGCKRAAKWLTMESHNLKVTSSSSQLLKWMLWKMCPYLLLQPCQVAQEESSTFRSWSWTKLRVQVSVAK
jgi:hypothetical protein